MAQACEGALVCGIGSAGHVVQGRPSCGSPQMGGARTNSGRVCASSGDSGMRGDLPVTTLRVRGYCTLFKSSPECVDQELVRVFGAGHGVRHVSTQQEDTSRDSTVYIVKVTGVRSDWEGKRIVEPDVHATEKRWERTEQVWERKPYEPVKAGMRLQVQKQQAVKPTIDQDAHLPKDDREKEAAMDADAAEDDAEEDML